MKSYKEMADSVFKRSDAIMKEEKERRNKMKFITPILSCLLVVVTIFGGTSLGVFNRDRPEMTDIDTSQEQPTHCTSRSQTPPDKILIPADDPDIVWAKRTSGDSSTVEWKNKQTGCDLYEALSNSSGNTVFAITVQTACDRGTEYRKYVYNGKTLAEYEMEVEEESQLPDKLARLLKVGDDLKYGNALYINGNGNGVKWTKEDYDNEIAYFGEALLSKYIVDGEFLREKLEYDCTQPVKIAARIAWHNAYEEYKNHIIRQTAELLTNQGVALERKNAVVYDKVIKSPLADPAAEDAYIEIKTSEPYLIIYVSKEKFTSLDGDYKFNIFNLAEKSARDGVLPSGSYNFDFNSPKDAASTADS